MRSKVKIGNRLIGEDEPVIVIAEVGSNHNRKIDQAIRMIDVAVECGCDAVKFQIYSANTLYPKDSRPYPILKKIEIDRAWIKDLADYSRDKGIIFMGTPFDHEAVDQLAKVDVPVFKWASPEIYDLPMLEYAAKLGKPIILSTGMCSIEDIREAIDVIEAQKNENIIILHCVSLYPTEPKFANIRMMDCLKDTFGYPIGFSDHTTGLSVPVAAVARGAKVIEKHFTLDRQMEGPDHPFALEPDELKAMVRAIRDAETCLGQYEKAPIKDQEDLALNAKSLVSICDIPKGSALTEEMITVKRSDQGIKPRDLRKVLHRLSKVDIKEDTPIKWEMIT